MLSESNQPCDEVAVAEVFTLGNVFVRDVVEAEQLVIRVPIVQVLPERDFARLRLQVVRSCRRSQLRPVHRVCRGE